MWPRQDAIVARINERREFDTFGFEISEYIVALDFSHAKPFLKDGVTEGEWEVKYTDRESLLAHMLGYMPFAWDKANNRRGISAWRSLAHCAAWLWLIGEDDLAAGLEDYSHYGKPQLARICDHFGWDWRQWDDNRWANDEFHDGEPADVILNIE